MWPLPIRNVSARCLNSFRPVRGAGKTQAAVQAGSVRMDATRRFAEDPLFADRPVADWDAAGLLKLMWETWNDVFRKQLDFTARSTPPPAC